ncbi:hypothetical protein SKAU_G00272280 [Synaphobranchus kaupii]|uniref:Uncharacterized protein n=1 Tax=Synaphobranchus kaupii TaxID=118154 RepID=A0A9Q1F0F8_SYNKA|nr:hypothetical protein SKAU_G00272280 [Synaphobranchus kaupii]
MSFFRTQDHQLSIVLKSTTKSNGYNARRGYLHVAVAFGRATNTKKSDELSAAQQLAAAMGEEGGHEA